ncbi:hypothetical protein [Flavobacterium sp.]|uniref:hypothetical protein n=1 Tax=Flavobacterium sp. TaxID=239 RepID=UPI0026156484|nr:hypothetical protein [Flavobacterium sp.]
MRKLLFCLGTALLLFSSCTEDRAIEAEQIIVDPSSQLVYYWNFNALPTGPLTAIAPDFPSVTTAKIEFLGTSAGIIESDTDGYTINARNGDAALNLLKARNPSNNKSLVFTLPTTGYKKIILQFATARSPNNGATTQNYSYTTDGTNYIQTGLTKITHNTTADLPDLIALDFTEIPAVNNNPNFKFKIDFDGATISGTSGNNRFDNVTLEGVPN